MLRKKRVIKLIVIEYEMKKEKLLGLIHTNDSYWFRLAGNERAMGCIESIFDLENYKWEDEFQTRKNPKLSYYQWLLEGGGSYLIDEKGAFAYVILTEKVIHLILRKVKKHEEIKKKIFEKFEVKKKKWAKKGYT